MQRCTRLQPIHLELTASVRIFTHANFRSQSFLRNRSKWLQTHNPPAIAVADDGGHTHTHTHTHRERSQVRVDSPLLTKSGVGDNSSSNDVCTNKSDVQLPHVSAIGFISSTSLLLRLSSEQLVANTFETHAHSQTSKRIGNPVGLFWCNLCFNHRTNWTDCNESVFQIPFLVLKSSKLVDWARTLSGDIEKTLCMFLTLRKFVWWNSFATK